MTRWMHAALAAALLCLLLAPGAGEARDEAFPAAGILPRSASSPVRNSLRRSGHRSATCRASSSA